MRIGKRKDKEKAIIRSVFKGDKDKQKGKTEEKNERKSRKSKEIKE